MNQENQPQNHQSFSDNFGQPKLFNLSSQTQFQSHLPPACAYNVSPSSFNSETESSKFSSAENGKPQFQSKWENEFSNSVQHNFPVTSLASGRVMFFDCYKQKASTFTRGQFHKCQMPAYQSINTFFWTNIDVLNAKRGI